jgi:hypothetical protein
MTVGHVPAAHTPSRWSALGIGHDVALVMQRQLPAKVGVSTWADTNTPWTAEPSSPVWTLRELSRNRTVAGDFGDTVFHTNSIPVAKGAPGAAGGSYP